MSASLHHPRYWPSWMLVGIARAFGYLPLPLLWGLGTVVGSLGYYLVGSRRRIARRNLELCFPELSAKEIDRLTRRHFAALGTALFSTGVSWVASKKRLKRLIRYRHREIYEQVKTSGRPIIFLAPHFLGLELGGMCFSLECPGVSMYQRVHDPVLDRQIYRGRCRYGGIMIERNASLKTLIKLLRQGTTFYYLPDQNPGRRRGVFVPFLASRRLPIPPSAALPSWLTPWSFPAAAASFPTAGGLKWFSCRPLNHFPPTTPLPTPP